MNFESTVRVFKRKFRNLIDDMMDISGTSILKVALILIAALIQVHISEDIARNLFESASRPIGPPELISATANLTIFMSLINVHQVIIIRMLSNSFDGRIHYEIYIEISTATSVFFLAMRSPFIALFSIERCLMNIYLAFFFMISAIVVHYEESVLRSAVILLTSHLSLVLVPLSLPCFVNLNMINTTFIMAHMIIYTFTLNVILLFLKAGSNYKVPTQLMSSIAEQPMKPLDTPNNSQHDETAQEVLTNEERTHEERTEEQKEKLFYEVMGTKRSSLNEREIEKRRMAVKRAVKEAEAILDDINCQIKVIDVCANFLLANRSQKENNPNTIIR